MVVVGGWGGVIKAYNNNVDIDDVDDDDDDDVDVDCAIHHTWLRYINLNPSLRW